MRFEGSASAVKYRDQITAVEVKPFAARSA